MLRKMVLRSCGVVALLISCSALWGFAHSSSPKPPPPSPKCDTMVALSSQTSSLSEGAGAIHSRSLSPWKWRSTTVKNRIPTTLWEAQCTSRVSSGPRLGQPEVHNLNSVPIYQNILVLTRQNNSHCYTASFQMVAVGCTSVRATISHS
ncbi:interleukin 17a/f2 [Takifugu flavidus]|uniref:Uncharacterized protein n=1 Tax=Takifugu flavidus TaxID=433684 RepID=A0A5C6NKV1_9TELE|nr:interleukin 17a/f2 [Takifugu flavidus]TWW67565.1 hypothetical protein D4764_02G0006060 [Takifugu flavidus]